MQTPGEIFEEKFSWTYAMISGWSSSEFLLRVEGAWRDGISLNLRKSQEWNRIQQCFANISVHVHKEFEAAK